MTPSSDAVAYDWPEGGGEPFDVTPEETRWVLSCRGRFGRTWPAGDTLDFGSFADFERRVPMGYATIRIVERRAVIDHGAVLREWEDSRWRPPAPIFDPYQHHVPGFEPDPVFEVLDGQGSKRGPDGNWIERLHDSYAAAIADACSLKDRRVLVVTSIASRGWH